MDLLRRLMSLVNRPSESWFSSNGSIPGYYLGQTYAAQPNSDELRRASNILINKTKKDLDRNNIPLLAVCFEESSVILRDGKNHKCRDFDVRRIVVSCVDAKNQRLLAIFYHNDSPYIASPMTTRGLECHLFLCRNKDIAKSAANKIGELLARQYKQPQRPKIDIDQGQVCVTSKTPGVDDFDYENVSKFFRQKVFNHHDRSMATTPSGSLSTCVTTTGYDSGRASTAASVDLRTDEYFHGLPDPIHEHEELDMNSAENITIDPKLIQNRYSVHYDLEDDDDSNTNKSTSDVSIHIDESLDDNSELSLDSLPNELQRLLDLDETDI